MAIATFRTEMSGDNENVPALIEALGLRLVSTDELSDQNLPAYKMGKFTVDIGDWEIEDLRGEMEMFTLVHDQFIDMHRCYQTLQLGTEPNNQWYMR